MNEKPFNEQFREDRVKRGFTLSDVAEVAGVSVTFLSDVERGRRIVSRKSLAKKMVFAIYGEGWTASHMVYRAFMQYSVHNQNKWGRR